MKFPESFKISKGKPLVTKKRYRLTDLGFEYDVPSYRNVQYNIDQNKLKDKISDHKSFYGYDFEIKYIETLILKGNTKSAVDEMYNSFRNLLVYEEVELLLDSHCLLELSPHSAKNIIKEFEYLITTLLPRDFGDLYTYVGLEYRTCYIIFFEIALNRVGFINSFYKLPDIIKNRIFQNETLESIYRSTCLTKKDISEAVSKILRYCNPGIIVKNKLIIEKYLFSLKEYYEKDKVYAGTTVDFVVYEDEKPKRFIVYDKITHLCFNKHMHRSKKRFNKLKQQDIKLSEYCRKNAIELLHLDNLYFENNCCKILQRKNCAEILEKNNDLILLKSKIEAAAISNRSEIKKSDICGCYLCESIFASKDITQWVKRSAVCPECDSVSVIGNAQGFDITQELFDRYNQEISFS